MDVASLPNDLWENITNYLPGYDVVHLAIVNRWTWNYFSQDQFWTWRLTLEEDPPRLNQVDTTATNTLTPLQKYARAYSLQFEGLPRSPHGSRGSCAIVPTFRNVFRSQQQQGAPSFSFDMWFCLLDGDTSEGIEYSSGDSAEKSYFPGGVLLGAQSVSYFSNVWANYHQQFAVISSDRKLYCSVVNEKPEIASSLEFNRWYHLALTYDDKTQIQRVYLDGQVVSCLEGQGLHCEWWWLSYTQVGTGCITASTMNFPKPQSCGWYPFNGLVDNFRMWKRELSSDEVQALVLGNADVLRGSESLCYSSKRDVTRSNSRKTTRVRCTRPNERFVGLNNHHPT